MRPGQRTPSGPARGGGAGAAAAIADLLRTAVDLHRQGRRQEAEALYRQALALQPDQPDALHLLGQLEHGRGRLAEALALFDRAVSVRPTAAFWVSLGGVLLDLQRWDEAAGAMRRAIALDPGRAEAHNALGFALLTTGGRDGAIQAFRQALAARPEFPEALNNLGSALRAEGCLDEAEGAFERAIALRPNYGAALANLGLVLQEQARYGDALDAYDRAVAAAPNLPAARGNRAMLLLLLGRLEEGFAEYQWRWKMPGFATPARDLGAPDWDGSPLEGRTLLVHAEQGLGSAIQFARYVPRLPGGRVILECHRPLHRLFSRSLEGEGGVQVVVKGEPLPPAQCQAPLMSLPHLTGTTLSTIPADVPYLRADPAPAAVWQKRIAALAGALPGPRVGLVWAGNPRHENDHNRSLPAPVLATVLAPLLSVATCFSLQVPGRPADLALLPDVIDLAPELADFADTAAVIEALDLVISVDTAVAHLAGALARPVWLLLPFVPEWRWLLDREDCPWYPTMRLFRQPAAGDWRSVFERVTAALAGWTGGWTGRGTGPDTTR